MTTVMINGDDMGLRHGINESVFILMKKGLMTGASMMVKMEAFHEAVSMAGALRVEGVRAGIGLHLDLDRYFGFDEHGYYGVTENDIVPWHGDVWESDRSDIIADMDRQAAALVEAGISPTHLDGHHNVHLFPWIMDHIIDLLEKYNIKNMRFCRSFYASRESLLAAENLLREHRIAVPDHFMDLSLVMEKGTGIVNELEGCVEIMAHTDSEDNSMGRVDQYRYLLGDPFSRYGKTSYV